MNSLKCNDINIASCGAGEVLHIIKNKLNSDEQIHIATVNPEFIVQSYEDSEFKKILQSTYLNTADGFGIKLIGWFKRKNIKRCTGIDLIIQLIKSDFINNQSIYLLGGKPGVAYAAARKILKINPDIHIAGTNTGFANINKASLSEYNQIISDINSELPTILLVGYNAPFAQKFITENLGKMPSVKIAMGIGGSFDFLAGNIKRAPLVLRAIGMEWLWRLVIQPSRLKRIYNATFKFLYLYFKNG